jgi:hypothetical protein
VFGRRHSAYILKLPFNSREIFDSWHPQQIPLGFSLFNGNDKPPFLPGHFFVKPAYQFRRNHQFVGCANPKDCSILREPIVNRILYYPNAWGSRREQTFPHAFFAFTIGIMKANKYDYFIPKEHCPKMKCLSRKFHESIIKDTWILSS